MLDPKNLEHPDTHQTLSPEAQELLDFTQRWDAAMVRNDVDEIAAFMSDDWEIVGSNGITSKAAFLEWIASGTVLHDRMDGDAYTFKVYGDTGIIIAKGTSAGTYKGEKFSLYEWSTSVCIKTDGKWKCVVTMLTPAK